MQWLVPNVDRTFGRRPKHALGVTAFVTVATIVATIAIRRREALRSAIAWQDPADAIRNAVVVCDGAIVSTPKPPADPDPTVPLTRAELAEVVEVDGGRPLHDLDHVQRACRHADSLYGRCADCGMTWAAQAAAMGGAR